MPAAYTYIRWSKVTGNTGERLMFRMTGENKSNTESAVPIHSSSSGPPHPPTQPAAPSLPLSLPMDRLDCLQPPTVVVRLTDVESDVEPQPL